MCDGLSYCGLALRHLTVDHKLENFILACVLYDLESQSANNIRAFVNAQLLSYELVLDNAFFIVTDNENNMRAAFKDQCTRIVDKKPVKCDIVQELFQNVRTVVTHVRRSHRQVKLKRKLKIYSDTRFNGAFYMLNVFLITYDDFGGVINNSFIDYLTGIDKELLEELCNFLELFDQVINQLSDEERPTMHKVLRLRQLLLDHCEMKAEDSDGLKELKFLLGGRIKVVWIPQDQHYMCTLFHPSMKHFHIAPHEQNKALELVKKELLKRASVFSDATVSKAVTTSISITFNTATSTPSNSLLSRCFDQPQPIAKSTSTPVTELHDYMSLDVQILEHNDVLSF